MAPFIGSGLALFGGPLLTLLAPWAGHSVPVQGPFEPWRGLLLLIGLPGLFVGLAFGLFIREPVRLLASHDQAGKQLSVSAFLKDHAGLIALPIINAAAMSVIVYTIYVWIPTYLIPVFSQRASEVGLTRFMHDCRPEVMDWCEANGVDYLIGLATTAVLRADPTIVTGADAFATMRAIRQDPVLQTYA